MATPILTAERLRELLDYDPNTGLFTRRLTRGKWKAGTKPGRYDRDGYLIIWVDTKEYRAHRLAWLYVNGAFPDGVIDHINNNPGDNRISNLRDTTQLINTQNVNKARKDSTTGLQGVAYHAKQDRYMSFIQRNGVRKYLGTFRCAADAHRAYIEERVRRSLPNSGQPHIES